MYGSSLSNGREQDEVGTGRERRVPAARRKVRKAQRRFLLAAAAPLSLRGVPPAAGRRSNPVQPQSAERSRQSGFCRETSSTFFRLEPALICFSRAIAAAMLEVVSKKTSLVALYRAVKLAGIAPCLVLEHAHPQVACDTGVENGVAFVAHHVDRTETALSH